MPTWRDPDSLFDIVDSARLILRYAGKLSQQQFLSDEFTQDAVLRRFLVIGKAAKRLSAEFRAAHPEVPLREMAAFRDFAVHNYSGVDFARVWAVVHADLPAIIDQLEPLIPLDEA